MATRSRSQTAAHKTARTATATVRSPRKRSSAPVRAKRAVEPHHEGLAAWLSDLFSSHEEAQRGRTSHRAAASTGSVTGGRSKAGRAGGRAPHHCRGKACSTSTSAGYGHGYQATDHEGALGTSSRSTSRPKRTVKSTSSSRSAAGRAGGLAPHRCRGRACSTSSARSSLAQSRSIYS